jgi:putative tryptophan/tyrosine transport system substrate-binding protein
MGHLVDSRGTGRGLARREMLAALARLGLALPATALLGACQQARDTTPGRPSRVPRVGYVYPGWSVPGEPSPLLEAFRQGLRDLGYTEGDNIIIEIRESERRPERYPDIVAELVAIPVDVLLVQDTSAIPIAMQATQTIPIVFALVGDPVAQGYAESLARPGGMLTGLTLFNDPLNEKRLELLKESVPHVSRVAVLWNAAHPAGDLYWREIEGAAPTLGLRLISAAVRGPDDFDAAYATIIQARADAIYVLADPVTSGKRVATVKFALDHGLPGMYPTRDYVTAGGLMSYAPSREYNLYRAASYVDKILKGVNPADIPIERPTRVDLSVNMNTANALGITFTPWFLLMVNDSVP